MKPLFFIIGILLIVSLAVSTGFLLFVQKKSSVAPPSTIVSVQTSEKNHSIVPVQPVQAPPQREPARQENPSSEGKIPLVSFSVPILMYHYIRDYHDPRDPIGVNLSVSPATFDRQLAWLTTHGYATVAPDYLTHPYRLDHKPILITIDDGYQDAFTAALPILQKYHLMATFYPIVEKIGTTRYLSWDELSTMHTAGMTIGSHTLTHPNLTTLTPDRLRHELTDSKQALEDHLGTPITDFCYPSGKYNASAETAVRAAGYTTATTTQSGRATEQSDSLALPRARITEATNFDALFPG